MEDLFRKAAILGLGALSVTKDKVDDLVKELVKEGKIGSEEEQKLFQDLLAKGEKSKEEWELFVENTIIRVLAKANIPQKNELEELKKQIQNLTDKLDILTREVKKPPSESGRGH